MIFSWFFLINLVLVSCSSSSSQSLRTRTISPSVFSEPAQINFDEARSKLYADIKKAAMKQGITRWSFLEYEIENWPEFVPPSQFSWDEQSIKDLRKALPHMIFKRKPAVAISNCDNRSELRTEYTDNRKKLLKLLTDRFNEQIGNEGKKIRIDWHHYHVEGWPWGVPIPAREWDSRKLILIYRQLAKIQFKIVKPGESRTITYSEGHSEVVSASRERQERVAKRKTSKCPPKRKGRKRRRQAASKESFSDYPSGAELKSLSSVHEYSSSESEAEDESNITHCDANDKADCFDSFDYQEVVPDLLSNEVECSDSEHDVDVDEIREVAMEIFDSYIKMITPVSNAYVDYIYPSKYNQRIYDGCYEIEKFEEEALQSYDPNYDFFAPNATDSAGKS